MVVLFLEFVFRAGVQPPEQTPLLSSFVQSSTFPMFQCLVWSIWVYIMTSLLVWRRGRAQKIKIRRRDLFSPYCQDLRKSRLVVRLESCNAGVSSLSQSWRQNPWDDFRLWNLIIIDCIKCPLLWCSQPIPHFVFWVEVEGRQNTCYEWANCLVPLKMWPGQVQVERWDDVVESPTWVCAGFDFN